MIKLHSVYINWLKEQGLVITKINKSSKAIFWDTEINGLYWCCACLGFYSKNDKDILYRLVFHYNDDNWYNEKEMLQRLKMKAFW